MAGAGIELATGYVSIVPSTRGIGGQLGRDIEGPLAASGGRAGDEAGRNFANGFDKGSSGFGSRIPSLARGLALGVGLVGVAGLTAAGGLAAVGVKGAAALETTTTSFTALLGSTQKATEQIGVLQAYAAKTPFEQQDVLGFAQQFYTLAGSIGQSKDQVVPFLDAIGNLGAVTGASAPDIQNAVRAIGQIGSSGKVTLENLNQISEAFPGFNGAAAIATATGQSTADVLKQISAGGLDATTGVNALLEGMTKFPGAANAMVKQSETLSGMWSTFTDTIKISLTNAFQPLIPVIKDTLGTITPIIGDTLKSVAPTIAAFVKGIAPVIGPLIQGLGQIIGSVLDTLGPVFAELAPLIKPLASAVAELFSAFGPVLQVIAKLAATLLPKLMPILDAFADLIGTIGEDLFNALGPVLPVIAEAFGEFAAAVKPMLPPLGKLISGLVGALAPILPVIATAAANLFQALSPLVPVFADLVTKIVNALGPQLPTIATALGQLAVSMADILVALTPLIPPIATLIADLVKIGGPVIATLVGALATLAGLMAGAVRGAVTGITGAVRGLLAAFRTAVTAVGTAGKAIGSAMSAAWTAVTGFVSKIANAIGGLPGKVSAFGGKMLEAGKHLISSLWTGLKSLAGGAGQFIRGVIGDIGTGLKNAFNEVLHLPWKLPKFKIGGFGHYIHIGGQTLFPRLAQGGLVESPGLFLMGDNPSGSEVALPLGSAKTTKALANALAEASHYRSGEVINEPWGKQGDRHYEFHEAVGIDAIFAEIDRRERIGGRL